MATDETVAVIPEQLRKARESLGLGREEVARTLGVELRTLENWEEGHGEPSLELLWALAEVYMRSTDYFLRTLPALPERMHFRLNERKAVKDLPQSVRETLVRFEELCRAEAELEATLDRRLAAKIAKRAKCDDPEVLATEERHRLGLGVRPVKDLREFVGSLGVRVFQLPIPDISPTEVSGISWWHREYGPCVLINARNNIGRRTFTLAHEYAHLLCDDFPSICAYMLDEGEERFANRFAAAFLMPARTITEYFIAATGAEYTSPDDKTLGKIAGHFGVGLEAAGRRLEELGLIPRGTTDSRITVWEQRPKRFRASKGPRWRKQLGENFVSLAISGYSAGHLSTTKLARYFGLSLRETLDVVAETAVSEHARSDPRATRGNSA